jgi:acyl dehydratase
VTTTTHATARTPRPTLEVGDSAPPVEHLLTRTDLVQYAGASGDLNPMHHDEPKAQAAGMPSVFGHGMFSMGLVGRALTDWVGIGALRAFSVRFTTQSWPGDTLTTHLVVTELRTTDDGVRVADVDCRLVNQDDADVIAGTATVELA